MPPYMTNLILVFAGLSTGYLLWFRDRRNEDTLRQSLQKDNSDLHASLTLAHATHGQLNDRFKRQTSQLKVLQRICDELSEISQSAAQATQIQTNKILDQERIIQTLNGSPESTVTPSAPSESPLINAALEKATAENEVLLKRIENQESTINRINEQTESSLNQKEAEHSGQIERMERRICSQAESIKDSHQHLQDLAFQLDVSTKKQITAEASLIDSKCQTAQLYEKIETLKSTCLRISQLETHSKNRDSENKQLKSVYQSLQSQYKDSVSNHNQLSAELADLRLVNKQSQSELDLRRKKEIEFSNTIESLKISNDQLQYERAELQSRLANHKSISESDSAVLSFAKAMEQRESLSRQFDAEHQGHLMEHAQRGMLFTSPPKKLDNLKFISGITEILEARLNDCGIYTYKQILAWNGGAVVEFSSLLGVSESLITKTWKQQAEFLAHPKDGQAAA